VVQNEVQKHKKGGNSRAKRPREEGAGKKGGNWRGGDRKEGIEIEVDLNDQDRKFIKMSLLIRARVK
jgi:hypothetical protein